MSLCLFSFSYFFGLCLRSYLGPLHSRSLVVIGNVKFLPSKIDELAALTQHQREFQKYIMLFMESWLTKLTLVITMTLGGFQLLCMDRMTERGKRKGEVLAGFVSNRWCKHMQQRYGRGDEYKVF